MSRHGNRQTRHDMDPRPFPGTTLAARIERAEARLAAGGARAAARRAPEAGAFARPLAGGFAACGDAASPFNKVAGLGFAGPLDETELAAVERDYAERGLPVRVELSNLAEPSIGALLTRRGYALVGFENVLGRPLAAGAEPGRADGVAVAESGQGEMRLWMDLVIDAFAHADEQGIPSDESFPRDVLESAYLDMESTGDFRRYLARLDGAPAGGAALRLDEGIAQLCGAATVPALRRRGVQSALLRERLEVAARRGCDLAVVTTQPGSKSQQNVQRQGFDLLYTRAVLVREP